MNIKIIPHIDNKTCFTSIRLSILMLALLFCNSKSWAQIIYPVQSTTQVIAPYTSYVPNYYTGTNEKLRVTLTNLDMQRPSIDVYLRMKIVSSTFSIITPPEVYTPSIRLQAGMPTQLSLSDLEVYFKKENMRISGGQAKFYQTMQLPDNFYRFQFDVYEINTNRLLSNPNIGFAQVMIASGEPPFLNMPQKGESIVESNIPSIMFSWTPRHMNSIASAYGTEYEFTMVEIYDKKVDPNNAFQYSRVLYSEKTRSTSFIHTAAQPMLQAGMRYAWRVRAVAKEGIEDANIFKNNGYSEIYWFDYLADCPVVQESGVVVEYMKANITWTQTKAIDYVVEYRKKGSSKWYENNVSNNSVSTIYNLKASETYEYRIGSRCTFNDEFQYSQAKAFTMPSAKEKSPVCGLMPNVDITDKEPISELIAGIPVFAGDFPVYITKVSNSGGRFSGEGYVRIPYMELVKVGVVFKNITVNSKYQLISGHFETKFDLKNNMIWDADKTLIGGTGVGDIRSGDIVVDKTVDYVIDQAIKPLIKDRLTDEIVEGAESDISKGTNKKYELTLTDSEGNTHTEEFDKLPANIKDQSGTIYKVNEDGSLEGVAKVSHLTLDSEAKDKIRDDIAIVTFEETDATKYALDVYRPEYETVLDYYQKYKPSDRNGVASAKFIETGKSDEIFVKLVEIKKEGFDREKVAFVTSTGQEYQPHYDESKKGWYLSILPSDVNDGQEIYVVYQEDANTLATLAHLNLYAYSPKNITIKLVPVNGFDNGLTAEQVQAELNSIYNKVGIYCTVIMTDDFNYPALENRAFNVTGSGLFATLTDDMKQLNAAYLDEHKDEKDICLFIIENAEGNIDDGITIRGDMPRNKQFGYLFKGSDGQTVAHEIGHGIFHLDHPFARTNGARSFDKNQLTDNLMHYYSGTKLVKIQWDMIHSPGLVIGLFEKDRDGMIKLEDKQSLGFSPLGHVISKNPEDAKVAVTNDTYFIYGFNIDDKKYIWNEDAYYLNGDKNTEPFIAWDTNLSGTDVTTRTEVAVWKTSKNPECYFLYQFVNVSTNYTSKDFQIIKDHLNTLSANAWKADYSAEAYKNIDACRLLFDQENQILVEEEKNKTFVDIKTLIDNDISCIAIDINTKSDHKLTELIQSIDELAVKNLVDSLHSEICFSSLAKLEYNDWFRLYNKIGTQEKLDPISSYQILRLMAALKQESYKDFLKSLSENTYLYDNLIVNMSTDYYGFGDYIEDFFFETIARYEKDIETKKKSGFSLAMNYILLREGTEDDIWLLINKLSSLSANQIRGVDINGNIEQELRTLMSFLVDDGSTSTVYTNFLKENREILKKLKDFRPLFELSKAKSNNRQAFALFTPDHESSTPFINNEDWIRGLYNIHQDKYPADIIYPWGKIIAEKQISIIKNGSSAMEIETFINTMLGEFRIFVVENANLNSEIWNTLSINCDNIAKFDATIAKQSIADLKNINADKRKELIEFLVLTKCNLFKSISLEDKNSFDDYILTKLIKSFDNDPTIFETIQKITLEKLYGRISDDFLGSDIAFTDLFLTISDVLYSSGKDVVFNSDKFYEKDNKPKLDAVIIITPDLVGGWNNTSYKIEGNKVKLDGKLFDYNEEVIIRFAGQITVADQTYTEGALLKVPAITALTIANAGFNQIIGKSAWLVFDTGLMFVGAGEAKILFTAGNAVRKAIVAADVVGSIGGIAVQMLDNSALTDNQRFTIQMVCLGLSVPNMLKNFKKVDDVIARLDGFESLGEQQKALMRAQIGKILNTVEETTEGRRLIDAYLESIGVHSEKLADYLNKLDPTSLKTFEKDIKNMNKMLKHNPEKAYQLWRKYTRNGNQFCN